MRPLVVTDWHRPLYQRYPTPGSYPRPFLGFGPWQNRGVLRFVRGGRAIPWPRHAATGSYVRRQRRRRLVVGGK